MNYEPKPIDTSHITLSDDLMQLCELLAENTHDVWAKGRVEQGWTYGPERNDQLKQTPCLVPYAELPESEKEYDRNTALETIKVIMNLGYVIVQNRILQSYTLDEITGMCEAYELFSILPKEAQNKIPEKFVEEMAACSNCRLGAVINGPLDITASRLSREGVKRMAYICSFLDGDFLKNMNSNNTNLQE